MRQRIHLTESQLYRLVEQALNELDGRTYMSAAEKRGQQEDATWDALRAYQNGVGNPTDYDKIARGLNYKHDKAGSSKQRLMQAAQNSFNNKYGDNRTFAPNYKREEGVPGTFSVNKYDYPTGMMRTVRNGEITHKQWGVPAEKDSYYSPENGSHQDAIIADYQKGDARYNRNRGKWESPNTYWNESIARRVTESVMRKLRGM